MTKYIRKKYPTICQYCQSTFLAYKKGKATRKYCSDICKKSAMTVQKVYYCENCGKEVIRTPSNIKNKIYCSKKCSDGGKKNVSINTKPKISICCQYCNVHFKVLPCYKDRKFCSPKCQSKWLSSLGTVDLTCYVCDATFKRKKSKVRSELSFCSLECNSEYRRLADINRGANHPAYTGYNSKYYGPEWRPQRRAALLRDNYYCQDCGISQEKHMLQFNSELTVHHIIPFVFWKFSIAANNLNNLTTLCKVCHGLRHSGDLTPSNYDKTKFKTLE